MLSISGPFEHIARAQM